MPTLEDRVTHLEKTLTALIKKYEGYVKVESDISEAEMNAAAQKFLETHFREYRTTQLHGIKYLLDPFTDNRITDFDGIFILESAYEPLKYSRNEEKVSQREKERRAHVKTAKQSIGIAHAMPSKKIVVIVETKHTFHKDDVNEKLAQLDKIHKFIMNAIAYKQGVKLDDDTPPWSEQFKKFVTYTDMHECDAFPYLIMGGLIWEPGARDLVQTASIKESLQDRLGILSFSGDRFTGQMYKNGVLLGGARKRKIPLIRNLKV